jgi:hypothetical protein
MIHIQRYKKLKFDPAETCAKFEFKPHTDIILCALCVFDCVRACVCAYAQVTMQTRKRRKCRVSKKNSSEELYEVSSVMSRRGHGSKYEYEVLWMDNSITWEPAESLG